MRPQVSVPDSEQYECPACGNRVEAPESKHCDCGAALRSLNNSRDL